MGCCSDLSDISLFPKPEYHFENYAELSKERQRLLFIPKTVSNGQIDYIPCFFNNSVYIGFRPNFLIFFHGNGEDIFLISNLMNVLESSLKMTVISVEYPGYSIYRNQANTNQNIRDIILNDSLIVYDKIKEIFAISDNSIFILGRSIGCVPATHLASKRNPGGLFLVSAFTSIKEVVNNHSFNLGGIFVKAEFETNKYIKDVKCPILLIHGIKDKLIPFEHSNKLFNEIKSEIRECHFVEEMTHDKYDPYEDIIAPIDSFLKKYKLIKNIRIFDFDLDDIKEFIIPINLNNYYK